MAREVVSVESRIDQVTVYARGARVRRVARVRVAGDGVLRFTGLPITALDGSVRVEVDGGATVTAVRSGFDVPTTEPAAEQPEELRAAHRRVAHAESEVERLTRALEQLAGSAILAEDPSEEPPAEWSAVLAARRALLATRSERERALRDQLAAARVELYEAQRAYAVAAERDARSGSARAAKLHEVRKHVELDVAAPSDAEVALRVEYQILPARWAPSYVARLDGAKAACELRAVVAQDSGEDWTGVALRLSTAEPDQFAELPELLPQKIGRRQPEPARRGFRPPPSGAELLYLDYERAFPRRVMAAAGAAAAAAGEASVSADEAFETEVPTAVAGDVGGRWDQDDDEVEALAAPTQDSRKKGKAPRGMAAAPMASTTVAVRRAPAPPPPGMPMLGAMAMAKTVATKEEITGEFTRAERASGPPPPRLDYGSLRMAPPGSSARGQLVPAPPPPGAELTRMTARAIDLALPPGYRADWSHAYDYAFASDGAIDVKSDRGWHSIAITARTGSVTMRHVTVPREQADVFRIATLANPFDGPLLPGPVDVYDRGQFLLTSHVELTAPGTNVELGLGVDPSVKVARNVEFREEATGMLRGTLRLVHSIAIELDNRSARPVDVEVRERVPVTRVGDDEVEVALGKIDPAWEKFAPETDAPDDPRLRGGYRWRVDVPAGSKQLLRAGYEVKIAGKLELVGGNRRES